jgi:hypothetical protein
MSAEQHAGAASHAVGDWHAIEWQAVTTERLHTVGCRLQGKEGADTEQTSQ